MSLTFRVNTRKRPISRTILAFIVSNSNGGWGLGVLGVAEFNASRLAFGVQRLGVKRLAFGV